MQAAQWSLKRLAWAYGCARKDSDEEALLLVALLKRTGTTRTRVTKALASLEQLVADAVVLHQEHSKLRELLLRLPPSEDEKAGTADGV